MTSTETAGSEAQPEKFAAEDGDDGDVFGSAAALSSDGTTALVGADSDEDPNGEGAGSAYVFEDTDGSWTQRAKLTPDDGDSRDIFAISVALSSDGTTALIGASADEDPNGQDAGSAYVFEDTDSSWTQQAKLTPDDGDGGDGFGSSAALSSDGTTALIGAFGDEDPNGERAGSAYVFNATEGSWTQQDKFAAEDGDGGDGFGSSAALSSDGTTALVGAFTDEDPHGQNAGSAYVFNATDGAWTQQAKLIAEDGDGDDVFGFSVALSSDGTTALVGALGDEDPNGERAGSAYVFEDTDGAWTQQAKLVPEDGDSRDSFGFSMALSSDGITALVGASGDEDPNGEGAGSAYVFNATDGAWTQQAKLVPEDGDSRDRFGASAGLSGDGTTALIGALFDEDPNGERAGSAYVFDL